MVLQSIRKFHRRNEAQALVEFALVFPIMLFLVLGIMQLTYIAIAQQVVNYATYAAVRSEIVQDNPGSGTSNMQRVALLVFAATIGVSLFDIDIQSGDDDIVDIELTYRYRMNIPGWTGLIQQWSGGPFIELSSRCAMRKESPGPS